MANTLYVVVYSSALSPPSSTQIAAGQDVNGTALPAGQAQSQSVSTADDYSFNITGLTAGTSYKASFWHDEADPADVETTAEFRTWYDHEESLTGALTTTGTLAPKITLHQSVAGALQSGGSLADTFTAGPITYTEALTGAMLSGGELAPVVGYAQDMAGDLQSAGDLADTFTSTGSYQEAFSGALQSGGDMGLTYAARAPLSGDMAAAGALVPVLTSSITQIGALSSGGALVAVIAYRRDLTGAMQSGGDLADTFTGGTGDYSESMTGALVTGGELVPVVQWGVVHGGLLTLGGSLADVADVVDCTDPPVYTLFDKAQSRLNAVVLRQFGESVTFPALGLTVTAVLQRNADQVPAAGARPGVPRDELRVRHTDICAHDIDQGIAVTVRGKAYRVVSVEPGIHGMTRLGIRRTH
jgi:hypothetical protein